MSLNHQTASDSRKATPWRLLLLLMAMTAIGPASLNMLVPALPSITTVLQTDADTVQLTVSLYLVSIAGAQLVLGPLSDRFGRRPVVLVGLTVNLMAALAASAATSIGALVTARIVQAVGAATGIVMGRTIIRDLFERDHAASMLGLITTAMVVAPMVSPLIGGILDTVFGWQAIFLFISIFGGLVLVCAIPILPETRPASALPGPGKLWNETRILLGEARFYAYVTAGALGSAPFYTFLGGGPYVTVTVMGSTPAEYGLWFAITSVGYMCGNFTTSRLSRRFGVNAMVAGGIFAELIGSGAACMLALEWPDGGPAIVFFPQAIISYGNGVLLPNAIAGAVSVRPSAAGTAAGMIGCAQMLTGAAAAQLISVLLASAGSALPIGAMMLAEVVVTGILFWVLVRQPNASSN